MTDPNRTHPLNVQGEQRAFFGRRSGKRLHKGQDTLWHELLPRLAFTPGPAPFDARTLFPAPGPLVLEIGYGGGEHLARKARENPQTNFIGCEVFTGGIAKLLQAIEENKLENIRLYTDDALKLLGVLPEASLDAVYLLYPDPWPKTRHHKRRFVSPVTLSELARVIRPGGTFHFASDIEDYANWTLAHVLREPRFAFAPTAPDAWHEPYPGWQPTRYEQKARREGRLRSFYFTFPRLAP